MKADVLVLSGALPLCGALIAVAWPRRCEVIGVLTAFAVSVAAVLTLVQVLVVGALQHEMGGWTPGLGIALRVDMLSAVLLVLVGLVVLASSIYATGYFGQSREKANFWPLWLLLLAALNALVLSGDLFNVYVTLELLGLTAVSLAALSGQRAAIDAALRYLLVGLLGSMLYLAGVALLYLGYGTLDLPAIATQIESEPIAWLALCLMTGGLLLKTALFPLHFWLPPAHANAPAPVSAVLSALVVKAGFYLVMRLWIDLFPALLTPSTGLLLGIPGAAAVLWGSWQAFKAERLKLLAAYSTVAQLGYLFLGLALLFQLAPGPARDVLFGGIVLMALTHGFAKAGLFLAAGMVQKRSGNDQISNLGGMAQRMPVTTFTIALAGIALIGLPPSGAFLGKWQLLSSALGLGQWLWVIVVATGSMVGRRLRFSCTGAGFRRKFPARCPGRHRA